MAIRVVNLTATIEIDRKIKLATIRPVNKRFSGVPMKFKQITFLVFNGNKIVSVGGRSICKVEAVAREFVHSLEPTAKVQGFAIKNMVGSLNTETFIDLDATYERVKNHEKCIYEPELFAALYVYAKDCLVILFHTGKVIFTGAKEYKFMIDTWNLLLSHIQWKPIHLTKSLSVPQQ